MEKRVLTCIGCPMGCELTVELDGKTVVSISGYTCKRGKIYGEKEVTHPTRIVTTTVRVVNGTAPVVPVKTKEDIPKDKIFECVRELKGVQVQAAEERPGSGTGILCACPGAGPVSVIQELSLRFSQVCAFTAK